MTNWNIDIYTRIYKQIKRVVHTPVRFDEEYFKVEQIERYVLDLDDSYLFYYEETGKILQSKNGEVTTVYRKEGMHSMLLENLKKLLKEVRKYDIA